MTSQRVLWTACPNGMASTGKLRISVAIGPQLMPSGSSATLADFPDWEDWPATEITWKVKIGVHTLDATVVSSAPSSALYQSLFLPTTQVDPYQYQSPTASPLYTYPASVIRAYFAGLYSRLAHNLPEGGGWHNWQQIVSEEGFGQLPLNGDEMQAAIREVRDTFPKGGGPIPPGALKGPKTAVTQAYLFMQPRAEPPPYQAAADLPATPVPQFDFHQAYSLLQRHPALMRLFGFVVDLEVQAPSGMATTVPLSVSPTWRPKLGAAGVTFLADVTTNVYPVTMTTSATWLAVPHSPGAQIAHGLWRLSDPGAYDVVEVDLDGASIKSLNFVQNVWNAQFVRRTAYTPGSYGVPALRSAGLSLAKVGHASALYQNWMNNNAFDKALSTTPPGPVTLHAEDIAQGYRFDVYDATKGTWYQLCARTGAPAPAGVGGYGIGSPQVVVPVPDGDEGWIEPAPAQPNPATSSPPPMYVPETLMRWSGWSLIASRPGKHIDDASDDSLEAANGNPPPPGSNFQLQIEYAATPGTLPTLRFGRVYRLRSRVVDLAGNSVPFDPHAPFAYSTAPVKYGRIEPVASPVVVPCAPRTPGESLETIVIRSNYDIANTSPLIIPAERHLAPPTSSEDMVEAHGVLDGPSGVPQASLYSVIAGRDGLSYKSPTVMSMYGGQVDTQPLNGSNEWIYYPPVASPTPSQPAFGVPYLPDVLGAGVSLIGLPGAVFKRVRVPFDTLGAWPARRAVRLVVKAGHGAPVLPAATDLDGELTVYAPKASVSTVRLSSWILPAQLEQMKLWQWLVEAKLNTPALAALILLGGHYMFTPYRELTIVHAVRQPLLPPWANVLAPYRGPGATYTYLNGDVRAHPPSTQRVDLLSFYVDPYDDGSSLDGIKPLENKARVAELPLAADQNDVIAIKDVRHDFSDTKHHDVFYNLLSTTRFLEYFTETVTTPLSGTTAVVVSPKKFAPGTVIVRGTGSSASLSYKEGVDYTENDEAGSIARIAGGSIADGATVQVQFVAPPVTRSSLEPVAHPPTKLGYLVSVPSSARPPVPAVRYLIPAFRWEQKTGPKLKASARTGNILRVYIGRPWFESGVGELLGVVVAAPNPGVGFPSVLDPFVSGYGLDPVFEAGKLKKAAASDFTLAVHQGTGLLLEEQTGSTPWVDVAGHQIAWDKQRQLWFSDIEIKTISASTYFPFVKLALVRYQPSSLKGLELSRVVQADFIQVTPDRVVSMSFPSPNTVKVAVAGPGYLATTDPFTQDSVQAYVQEATVQTSDADLVWTTVPSGLTGTPLNITHQSTSVTIWEGTVKLPSTRGTKKYRVLVAESEHHKLVRTGNVQAKVTYLDAIEI
jgi:hypothetical protein